MATEVKETKIFTMPPPPCTDLPVMVAPIAPVESVDAGIMLGELTIKALRKVDEILSFPLDKEDRDYLNLMKAQGGAVATVLSTAGKMQENMLRAKQADGLDKLLAAIRAEDAKRGVVWNPEDEG